MQFWDQRTKLQMYFNSMILHLTAIATECRPCEGEGASVLGAGSVGIVRQQSHSETLYTSNCIHIIYLLLTLEITHLVAEQPCTLGLIKGDIFTGATKFKSTVHSVHSDDHRGEA